MTPPPTIADIEDAAARIAGAAVRTPLLAGTPIDERVGRPVLLKAEVLQRTGSFKYRGAHTFLSRIDPERRRAGVVAYSSGNHAQGVAAAAAAFGVPATIVMPADAPVVKIARTRALGAAVVTYDRAAESREGIGRRIAAETGATLVPPYDHPWTISGQGTAGLEIAEQAAGLGISLESVVVPCSGGGLTAGIALALEARSPGTLVYTVEPAGHDDYARSLAAGRRLTANGGSSLCDALLVPTPGEVTFPINRRLVATGLAVEDGEVLEAMRVAASDLKLVVEPGGAAGLAALLAGKVPGSGPVAIVLSGGNVDPDLLAGVLGG
jgi:threonine dehydratase